MDIANTVLKGALGAGLIFFILNNVIKRLKTKTKAWINVGVGVALSGLFGLALVVDFPESGRDARLFNITFMASVFTIALSYALYYFISGYGFAFARTRDLESKFYYQEFVYLIFRHGNVFYLKKDKNGFYSGVVSKAKKSRFLEDVINELLQEMRVGISASAVTKVGKLTFREPKEIYHCFYADGPVIDGLEGFEEVNAYEAATLPMRELDKEIIFRIIIREKFDIEK